MKFPLTRLLLAVGVVAITTTGCVQTVYTKSVQVKRDAEGKILEVTETEAVSQPGAQSRYFGFDHLKARSSDPNPIKPK